MTAINPLTTQAFDTAFAALPPTLAPIAKQRVTALVESPILADALSRAGDTDIGIQVLLSLPQVLASSEFISHALLQSPGLLQHLLETDCVLQPRKLEDIGHRITNSCAVSSSIEELMSSLRDIRRREFARIGWRDIAGLAPLKEVLATMSCVADEAIRAALKIAHKEISKQYGEPIGTDSGRSIG